MLQSLNNCYIATEYCKYGDLDGMLKMKKKFTEKEISPYIYQIYHGMKYLSDNKIVHRDLKLANIFMNEDKVCKIADFGFAIRN